MAKRGRPKKAGARTPSGQLSRAAEYRDNGTPEGNARRSHFYRSEDVTYALGIMFANEVIGQAELSAGERMAWAFGVVFGKVSPAAVAYEQRDRGQHDGPPERIAEIAKRTLNEADAVCASSGERKALRNLVIYNRLPDALRPSIPSDDECKQAHKLVDLLERLARQYGYVVEAA